MAKIVCLNVSTYLFFYNFTINGGKRIPFFIKTRSVLDSAVHSATKKHEKTKGLERVSSLHVVNGFKRIDFADVRATRIQLYKQL